MKYTKEEIEERLKERLNDLLALDNQEGSIAGVYYDEHYKVFTVDLNVFIYEEDDYIGFSRY